MKPVPTDHARANPQCCSHRPFANRCDGPTSFASRAGRPTKDSGTRVPVSLRPLARARANRFLRRSYPLVHAGRVGMTGPWTGLPSKPLCPSAPGPGALPPVRRAGAGAPESPGDSPFAGSPQRGTSSLGGWMLFRPPGLHSPSGALRCLAAPARLAPCLARNLDGSRASRSEAYRPARSLVQWTLVEYECESFHDPHVEKPRERGSSC